MSENIEIIQIFDCNVSECNGKHYVNVTNIRNIALTFKDYSMNIKSDKVSPIITKTINHVVNTNGRIINKENGPSRIKALDETTREFYLPIFEKFSIEELLQKDCE